MKVRRRAVVDARIRGSVDSDGLGRKAIGLSGRQPTKPLERRKERQRARIIEEAVKLYHENGAEEGGFEATMVEDIATRADISVRTFFRYFDSKQDVIFLDTHRATADLKRYVSARLRNEPPELAAYNGSLDQISIFMSIPTNRERVARAFKSPHFADRRAVWQQQACRAIAALIVDNLADRADPPFEASNIATLVRGAVDDALVRWADHPADDPLEYVRRSMEVTSIVARKISTQHVAIQSSIQ